MGTWGPGNFDDDTAADHFSIVTGKRRAVIEQTFDRLAKHCEPASRKPARTGSADRFFAAFTDDDAVGRKRKTRSRSLARDFSRS